MVFSLRLFFLMGHVLSPGAKLLGCINIHIFETTTR